MNIGFVKPQVLVLKGQKASKEASHFTGEHLAVLDKSTYTSLAPFDAK